MADQVDAKPPSGPVSESSSSKAQQFKNWLRNFGKRGAEIKPTNQTTSVAVKDEEAPKQDLTSERNDTTPISVGGPTNTEPTVSVRESEVENRPKGIARFIEEEIAKKGLVTPEYKEMGASGFHGTNEKVDPKLLDKLKNQPEAPNGYLIGVGVSNIFSLLDTFPKNSPPKGLVFVNVDPATVREANTLIDELKKEDPNAKATPEEILPDGVYQKMAFRQGLYNVDTNSVFQRHRSLLRQLAEDGNIAMIQQDFLNPDLIEIFSRLPQLQTSNNVVYMSNISDWVFRASDPVYPKFRPEDFTKFQALSQLQSESPHKTYYADTLQVPLQYQLRISSFLPEFSKTNFFNYMDRPQTLPHDQIDGTQPVSLSYLEYRGVSLEDLQKKFNDLNNNPNYRRVVEGWTQITRRKDPTYNYDASTVPMHARYLFFLNQGKEKLARGETPTQTEKDIIENEEFYTDGGVAKEEAEMAKIYLEVFWRVQAKDPNFNTLGKTTQELLSYLSATP